MLTEKKRKVLKRVRQLIASKEQEFICHAIHYVADNSDGLDDACRELKMFVTHALGNNYTLFCWQKSNGFAEHDDQQLRKDRLAWIDWMLDEPFPLY